MFVGDYPGPTGRNLRLIISGPAFLDPAELSGVVLYLHPYASDSEGLVVENCLRLAQSGIVAVAPFDPAVPDATDAKWWGGLADELTARLGREPGMMRLHESWEEPRQDSGFARFHRVDVDRAARAPSGPVINGLWVASSGPLLSNAGRDWEAALRVIVAELGQGGARGNLP